VQERPTMYGLIVKLLTNPGQRQALLPLLLEGVNDIPGLKSFVVALDPTSPDALFVTEVWESKAHHQASFALPVVRDSIKKAEALMAGMELQLETEPVGGKF
jgi:quinol monooxygenase YgiN